MTRKDTIGIIGQWCGLLAIVAGIAAELAYGAALYLILITAGSLAWGIGTKIRGH